MEEIKEHYEICPYCDTVNKVSHLNEGESYKCFKCNRELSALVKDPIIVPFVYAICSLFLFICSEVLPFLSINKMGITADMSLMETATSMFVDNYEFLAIFIYCNMQLFPVLCLLCVIYVYGCILLNKVNFVTKKALKLFFHLKEWSMVEVFMIAILVSMVKLVSMVDLSIGDGFITFSIFIFCYVKTVSSIDKSYVWSKINKKHQYFYDLKDYIGKSAGTQGLVLCHDCDSINKVSDHRCYNCNSRVHIRNKNSVQKCMALVCAAAIMLIPANVFPIMITSAMGSDSASTIFEGVIYMWSTGSYFVALVIFVASVMVPFTKIAILVGLCYSVSRKREKRLELKTKLYGITEFIGKWSMVDVFVVAIMSALIKMGSVLSIYPGVASLSFCATVVLTMLAANSFDPRNLWSDVKNDQ